MAYIFSIDWFSNENREPVLQSQRKAVVDLYCVSLECDPIFDYYEVPYIYVTPVEIHLQSFIFWKLSRKQFFLSIHEK